MSLDVCVCPLKAGLDPENTDMTAEEKQERLALIEKDVALIKAALAKKTKEDVPWDASHGTEEDYKCERLGNYAVLHQLRRYAAHLDVYNKPPAASCDLEEATKDEALLKLYDGETGTSFPHLIDHSDCDGYYLPVSFNDPIWIDKDGEDEVISVGSTVKLLQELRYINKHLQVDPDLTENLETLSEGLVSDDLEFEKWAWAVLYAMCLRSLELNLPIIFC